MPFRSRLVHPNGDPQAKPLKWTASLLRPSSIQGGRPRGLSMIKHTILNVGSVGMAWALAACNTTQERVTGAGAGAVVGSVAGPAGAAVGAVGGAIVGPTVSNATVDRK